jgi:hypothetical protein
MKPPLANLATISRSNLFEPDKRVGVCETIPNEWLAGLSCAIALRKRMNRFALAALMVTALFVSAVRLPASACPISSPPIGQACKQGSCPNKKCCDDAEKNKSLPSPPLAKADSASQQLVGIVTRSPATCLFPVQPVERLTNPSAHGLAASATPKRVFLCTFLI